MPYPRLRRLVQGQGGSTLIELLIAMPIAIMLLGLVVQSLGTAGRDQQDIEGRSEALTNGQIGLEKMTHELRQASWLYFRSSSVVDVNVPVRATATASGTNRLVRFDCSGETCTRSEGPPVMFPPPAAPTFTKTQTLIGSDSSDGGRRATDRSSATTSSVPRTSIPTRGSARRTSSTPTTSRSACSSRSAIAASSTKETKDHPIVISDGVSLRNRTTFAG